MILCRTSFPFFSHLFYQNNVYPHKPWDVDVFTLAIPAEDNKHTLRRKEAHDDNDQNHQALLVCYMLACVCVGGCVCSANSCY